MAEPPRQGGFEKVAFHIFNLGQRTVALEGWVETASTHSVWKRELSQTFPSEGFSTLEAPAKHAAIWIDQFRYVYAFNPVIGFSYLELGFGGPMGSNGWS